MGNTSDEVRLLDEEIKGIQGEIKSLEVMYEIHSLQQMLDKYDEIPVSDVILSSTEEKLLDKYKELNSPLSNFPDTCHRLEVRNERLSVLLKSREEKLNSILQNKSQTEPEKQTPEAIPEENNYLLDSANYLHIGRIPIKLAPSCADLLRFIIRELKDNDSLELQYILAYHYGDEGTMSKMTLSKNERQPFEKEKYKINSLCKKILKKNLIKSLGNKKFTLSLNIKLPENSPKDFP